MDLNKIFLGDAVETMKTIPDASVDLIVTSPPYNLRETTRHGNGGEPSDWKAHKQFRQEGYDDFDDKMPVEDYIKWQRAVLSECMRLLNDRGAIFYNHTWRTQDFVLDYRVPIVEGFPVRQIIVWDKCGMSMGFLTHCFAPVYEVIYLIAKRDFRIKDRTARHGNLWRFPPARGNTHPAPFPLDIPRRCIASTDAKVVLDPFMGSGTTAIAAEEYGRDWIGIEKSEAYVEMANRRIADFRNQLTLGFMP